MADTLSWDKILHWVLFAALATFALLMDILPIGHGSPGWPAPEWLLVLACAWVIRRPYYVPLGLFAALAIIADLLLMRPPGLYALLSVIVVEFLRSRAHAAREWPFLLEWAMVAVLLFLVLLGNRFMQMIFVLPQARFGLEMQEYLSGIIAYPLLVGLSVWLFGLARPRPGETGADL